MPQDPNLYGQRPSKKAKREMELSSSLSFTSQLSSLLTSSSSSLKGAATAARQRPSDSKPDLFGRSKKRKAEREADASESKLVLKEANDNEADKAERLRARKNMESKARLYNAMKRGDYVAKEGEIAPLVDFDRKWADENPDGHAGSSSGDDSSDDDGGNIDNDIIEFEDEFGRLRRGTRAEKMRLERRAARGAASAQELERMSARPKAPDGLIFGDAVQADAFEARDYDKMEELAAKRDRSVTPPPATHYDANWEVRTKGVGFYAFSKDEQARQAEMAALDEERARTEKLRSQRDEIAAKRKAEIERRRKELGERKAKKMAEEFLDGLGQNMALGGNGSAGPEREQAPEEERSP
ncbi:hypothetical protein GQ53DRAFT_742875 [Thozetella sp. PMI_491]|nr:hypothetical protein GQ53DRAFT_742875 [Thozetella sp. PMI_491]